MINKRLIGTVPDSKPYIAGNVALQWFSLLSNAGMIFSLRVVSAAAAGGRRRPPHACTAAGRGAGGCPCAGHMHRRYGPDELSGRALGEAHAAPQYL